jgi:hypothetical protein
MLRTNLIIGWLVFYYFNELKFLLQALLQLLLNSYVDGPSYPLISRCKYTNPPSGIQVIPQGGVNSARFIYTLKVLWKGVGLRWEGANT